jgi:hypothetical protein
VNYHTDVGESMIPGLTNREFDEMRRQRDVEFEGRQAVQSTFGGRANSPSDERQSDYRGQAATPSEEGHAAQADYGAQANSPIEEWQEWQEWQITRANTRANTPSRERQVSWADSGGQANDFIDDEHGTLSYYQGRAVQVDPRLAPSGPHVDPMLTPC